MVLSFWAQTWGFWILAGVFFGFVAGIYFVRAIVRTLKSIPKAADEAAEGFSAGAEDPVKSGAKGIFRGLGTILRTILVSAWPILLMGLISLVSLIMGIIGLISRLAG